MWMVTTSLVVEAEAWRGEIVWNSFSNVEFGLREKENKDADAPPQRRLSVLVHILICASVVDSDLESLPDGGFCEWVSGTLSGRLTDTRDFRIAFAAGTLLNYLSVFIASHSTTLWQLLLSQGLCTGLGNGLMFTPSLAVVLTYFKRKGALAFASWEYWFCLCGWSMELVQLITLVMANLLLRPRIPPRQSGPWIDLASFKQKGYLFFAIAIFFKFCAIYIPFYYLASFAVLQMDKLFAFPGALNALLVVNGVGIIGRSRSNAIAHHFRSITVLMPVVFMSSKCLFTWPAVSTEAGSYAWASVYGIVAELAGASMSLFPSALSDLTMDVHKTGVRMGMIFTTNSIATLTGPPIAGMITRRSGGHYLSAQIFAGASLLLSGVSIFLAKRFKRVGDQDRAT
ncbi:hypothetical protein LB504_006304 [Fusarium proliferatum]|nr:hypothetical protein LB504_006304 [Fusarium proliferatum]